MPRAFSSLTRIGGSDRQLIGQPRNTMPAASTDDASERTSRKEAEDEEMRNRLKTFLASRRPPATGKLPSGPSRLPSSAPVATHPKVRPVAAPSVAVKTRPPPLAPISRKRPAPEGTPKKLLKPISTVFKSESGTSDVPRGEECINECRRKLLRRRALEEQSSKFIIAPNVQHLANLKAEAVTARRAAEPCLARELPPILAAIREQLDRVAQLHEQVLQRAQPIVDDDAQIGPVLRSLDQLDEWAGQALKSANHFVEFPNLEAHLSELVQEARRRCLLVEASNNQLLLDSI